MELGETEKEHEQRPRAERRGATPVPLAVHLDIGRLKQDHERVITNFKSCEKTKEETTF